MDSHRFRRLQQLVREALPLDDPQRRRLIERECGGDDDLIRELEGLLADAAEPMTGPLEHAFAAPVQDGPLASTPRRIGPYELLERVGEGGMGEVWRAEQREPVRRTVAIKLIKPGMDTRQVVARFEAERQALAMMDHPCVAKVFEAGSTPAGRPYFVMEYVDGVPITEHCDRHRLPIAGRLELFMQVCDGVQHAHHKAIIHRDLKPSNVLVAVIDGKALPKVIDFGVAKATAQPLTEKTIYTQVGALVGTPEYMSPEQIDLTSEGIDTRTDVYALGVILYELLVGAMPFEAGDLRSGGLDEIKRKIREDDPPRPSTRLSTLGERSTESARNHRTDLPTLARQLRGDLDWITMKALEKSPSRRYASPHELAADIRRHQRHEPVLAGPPSAAYRMRKFVRRHRIGVSVATTGLVVLVAFAATMAVQAGRIARERDRANLEADLATRVAQFMTDLFTISNPSQARGNSITARELLDKAAAEIGTGLSDQPQLQARLMLTMGNVYGRLGLYEPAQPLLEAALELDRDLFGAHAAPTLVATNSLAGLYGMQGRLDEAEQMLLDTVAAQATLLGVDASGTLVTRGNLAWLYMQQGRYDDAEAEYLEVLRARERTQGLEHLDTIATRADLAWLYYRQSRLGDAESNFRDVLLVRNRRLGPDHPKTLHARNGLASVLNEAGELDEAERHFEQIISAFTRIYGPQAPPALAVMQNLAGLYQSQGRLREKEALDVEILAVKRRVLGDDHPSTLTAMNSLGIAYWKQGRLDAAEALLAELLETRRRVSGPEHDQTLNVMNNLAGVYANQKRYDDAETLHRQTLLIRQQILGDDHTWTLTSMMALGGVQTHRGVFDEAESLLESAHAALIAKLGAEHLYVGYSHYYLAGLAASTGRRPEAVDHLRNALRNGWAERDILDDETLDPVRDDPDFQAILDEVRAKIDS